MPNAKKIIQDGNVTSVFQSHTLQVRITMADGARYKTTEPAIDDVIAWVRKCGKQNSVVIMTE